jgi:hypothetical protein
VKGPDEFAESFAEAQGVILGPLQAHLHDRIKVGEVELLLTGGATSDYPIGTAPRVTYTKHDGIKEASRVVRAEW